MCIRHITTIAAFLILSTFTLASAPVVVIEDAPWSPGDAEREGAAELDVLLRLAQLQQEQTLVGLVGIGDRRGVFQEGTRRGLEFAVRQGVPVVRLSRAARPSLYLDGDLFIDGGAMSPAHAADLLARCLHRFGALPRARVPTQPTADETLALRRMLQRYQAEFTTQPPARLAAR
jgi:hypothetical protein